TVGEIRGVNERKGERGEQVLALGAPRRVAHDRRGVPLAVDDRIALAAQPLGEQGELRALPRTVDALDDEQSPRIRMTVDAVRHRAGQRSGTHAMNLRA